MFGASTEPASVLEFGLYFLYSTEYAQEACKPGVKQTDLNWSLQWRLSTFHTHTTQPLYRSTCVRRNPQWTTEWFCWSKVLLLACPCWQQLVHLH